jgi:outer membrane protein assembly factor BamB
MKKKWFAPLVLSAMLLAAPALAAPPTPGAWPTFGHDPQHTGRSPYVGPHTPRLEWSVTVPSMGFIYGPVLGASGTVYVTTHDGYVHALRPSDGARIWTYRLGGTIRGATLGPDEELYFAGSGNGAMVVRLQAGVLQWKFDPGGFSCCEVTRPAYVDGTVYVGFGYNRTLYALDAGDGTVLWSYRVGDFFRQFSSPAVSPDGTVYFGSTDGNVYALDGADGSLRWQYQTGGTIWISSSAAIGTDGTVYIGSGDGYLYALNESDGSLRWRYQAGAAVSSSPGIGVDGTIYVGSDDGYVYALDGADGSLRWRYQTGGHVLSYPAIGGDGTVHIGSTDGYLYALSGHDGTLKWRYPITWRGEYLYPAIGSDGTLYVAGWTSGIPSVTLVYAIGSENNPPIASAGGPYSVGEGSSAIVTATGSDPEGGPLTFDWDLDNDGTFETPGQSATFSAATLDGPGSKTITVRVTDNGALSATAEASINVLNVPPTLGTITAAMEPIEVNTAVSASADFTDPGMLDTHTAIWDWGDGSSSAGAVNETNGSGAVGGDHTYSSAGVYTVTLTVTDKDGGSGQSVFQYVVVYDPSGGFVTGGGWINSPAAAYAADPSLAGKATFGLVSKYTKGVAAPSGVTEFQFRVGSLNFHSDTHDWLVIAGARAQYKGTGTINGEGNYGFMLTAIDGQSQGGGGADKFRIKIWDKASNAVVYDNQIGDADDAAPLTVLQGGSILIHG